MTAAPATFLGLDIGGTVIKAAVFDEAGAEIAVRGAPFVNTHPAPGRTERDPLAMWDAAAAAIRAVLEAPGVDAARIAAVCCTGHGNGAYLFDGRMRPACPGVVSSDTRTEALAVALMATPEGQALAAASEQLLRTSSTALVLMWFERNAPEVARATRHVLLCKDYVRYRLTGVIDSDANDLSGSQLVHVRTGDYDDALFAGLGIAGWRDRLPPIRRNTDISGHVTAEASAATGLCAGTPVVAGMMDVAAVTLASGVTGPDEMAVCAGTWSIDVAVRDRLAGPPWPMMQAIDRDGAGWLVCEGSPTSATNLAWFRNEVLRGGLDYDQVNALVASSRPDAAPVYLPYIHGDLGSPRAAFVGLGTENGLADLLRAVFEGVVFKHQAHIDDLVRVTGRPPRVIRLSGGAANSDVWAQMFADALGLPVEIAAGSEFGALGSAMCAAVAVGVHAGFDAAVRAMTRTGRRFEPRREAGEVYRRKRAGWTQAETALAAVWPAMGNPSTPRSSGATEGRRDTP